MRQGSKALAAAALLLLAGCAGDYPTAQVKAANEKPQLAVIGASDDAELIVNGVLIGPAAEFDGETRALEVPSGANRVQIRDGGQVIYDEQVFTSGGVRKTITLP